jgi:hypothetical protein
MLFEHVSTPQSHDTVNMVMSPAELGPKNKCAGEYQQQFLWLDPIVVFFHAGRGWNSWNPSLWMMNTEWVMLLLAVLKFGTLSLRVDVFERNRDRMTLYSELSFGICEVNLRASVMYDIARVYRRYTCNIQIFWNGEMVLNLHFYSLQTSSINQTFIDSRLEEKGLRIIRLSDALWERRHFSIVQRIRWQWISI